MPGHVSVVDRGPLTGLPLNEVVSRYGAQLMGAHNEGDFPLLVKIIDAREDLSVQVHPGDELARERHGSAGKTEMWHVIETAPGAKIYTGLNCPITPEEYERRVADGSIMDVVAAYDSAPGDTFYLPSGRIHAIGAGNLLAEIQQTSDITYRIYDYNRRDSDGNLRDLHTAEARDAIDYTVRADYRSHPEGSVLADCEYFEVRKIEVDARSSPWPVAHERDSFTIIMCLGGEATVSYGSSQWPIRRGETLLFPASMTSLTISAKVASSLLSVQA